MITSTLRTVDNDQFGVNVINGALIFSLHAHLLAAINVGLFVSTHATFDKRPKKTHDEIVQNLVLRV